MTSAGLLDICLADIKVGQVHHQKEGLLERAGDLCGQLTSLFSFWYGVSRGMHGALGGAKSALRAKKVSRKQFARHFGHTTFSVHALTGTRLNGLRVLICY